MDAALKRKVEAILFSAGQKISVEDIAKLCGRNTRRDAVLKCLERLQQEYHEDEDSSMMVYNEGDMWKLTVKDDYISVVRRMGTETELSKTVMETLAVIAFKAPVLQSEVIKIRTNKAYDHLKELEELGYITRKKEGRTKRIDLTQRFFDYFDLPPEELKKRFKRISELQEQVEYLEGAVKEREQEHQEQKAKVKALEEQHKEEWQREAQEIERAIKAHPGIELKDPKSEEELLEAYKAVQTYSQKDREKASPIKQAHEYFGTLEVVDEPPLAPDTESGKDWGALRIVDIKRKNQEETTEESQEEHEQSEDQTITTQRAPAAKRAFNEEKGIPEESGSEGGVRQQEQETDQTDITTVEPEDVQPKEARETERIFSKGIPESVQERIDARVDELLNPEKEQARRKKEQEERRKKWDEDAEQDLGLGVSDKAQAPAKPKEAAKESKSDDTVRQEAGTDQASSNEDKEESSKRSIRQEGEQSEEYESKSNVGPKEDKPRAAPASSPEQESQEGESHEPHQ